MAPVFCVCFDRAPLGRASIARPAIGAPGEPLELLEGRLPRHRDDDALRELQRAGKPIYRPGRRVLEACLLYTSPSPRDS